MTLSGGCTVQRRGTCKCQRTTAQADNEEGEFWAKRRGREGGSKKRYKDCIYICAERMRDLSDTCSPLCRTPRQ